MRRYRHRSHHRRHRHHRLIHKRDYKYIITGIVFLLCLSVAFLLEQKTRESNQEARQEYTLNLQEKQEKVKEVHEELEETLQKTIPGIVCLGDSWEKKDTSWTAMLQEEVDQKIVNPINEIFRKNLYGFQKNIEIPVEDRGNLGENTELTLARSGAVPFVLSKGISIPADDAEVQIFFQQQETGNVPRVNLQEELVQIGTIEGTISSNYNSKGELYYTFKRTQSENPQAIEAGETIYFLNTEKYNNYIPIIFMGEYGGYEGQPSKLVEQQKKILEQSNAPEKRYLILGLYSGTKEEKAELESVMQNAWGDHFVNLREYLSSEQAMKDANMMATEEDLRQMENGSVPGNLLIDGVNLTQTGNRLVADLIYKRMDELGYFSEVNQQLTKLQEVQKSFE